MTVIRQYVAVKSADHTCVFESELGRMVSRDLAFLQCEAEGVSMHDEKVIYRKGEVIEPLNGWGENRWDVCAPGIHFFITRAEAEAYDE